MITTNTGAKKLESSDNWREIFPNPGTGTAGAHNASVDAQDRIQAEVAPIINGKQCALGAASGDYVLLRNSTITGKSDGAYIATKAIPANTDIDSTYLGNAITGGISNSLNNKLTHQSIRIGSTYFWVYQFGKVVVLNGYAENVNIDSSGVSIGSIPSNIPKPDLAVRAICNVGNDAYSAQKQGYFTISTAGDITVYSKAGETGTFVYACVTYIAM